MTAWKAEPPPGRARELSNRGHVFAKTLRAAFPRRQRPADSPGYPGEQTADLPSCRGPGRLRFRWLGRRRVFRAIALCGRSLEGPGGATSVLRALGFSAPRVLAQGPRPGSWLRVPAQGPASAPGRTHESGSHGACAARRLAAPPRPRVFSVSLSCGRSGADQGGAVDLQRPSPTLLRPRS